MDERKITTVQIIRCLKSGTITEGPARGLKGNWEMTFGSLAAGDPVTTVIALKQDKKGNYILVVTVYNG